MSTLLESVAKEVDAALESRSFRKPEYRPVPYFGAMTFSWVFGTDTLESEKTQTIFNAAPGELRLYRIGYNVSRKEGSASYYLPSLSVGSTSGFTRSSERSFDFEWQMNFLSSSAAVGLGGHNSSNAYMTRTMLGSYSQARSWENAPFTLGLGEGVRISVRPTVLFAYTGTPTFTVKMFMIGARSYA